MDRVDFCKMLTSVREEVGIGKNEMCRRTGFTFLQLQLLEDKTNNFSLDKPFHYLECLNRCIVVSGVVVDSIHTIAEWVKKSRTDVFTQRSLAKAVGCTHATIANIERGSNKVRIDTFLKLAEIFNCTIKIEPK